MQYRPRPSINSSPYHSCYYKLGCEMPPEPLDYQTPFDRKLARKLAWRSSALWWYDLIVKWFFIVAVLTFIGIAVAIVLLMHHWDSLGPTGD
jgi:hypothetical protein